MFENIGLESSWGCKRMHAIGEQQPKWMRSGAAAEALADASGDHAAAAEAGAVGDQQLDGEQQLKRMQSGQGAAADSKRTQAASSSRSGCNRGPSGCNRGAAALHRELFGADYSR